MNDLQALFGDLAGPPTAEDVKTVAALGAGVIGSKLAWNALEEYVFPKIPGLNSLEGNMKAIQHGIEIGAAIALFTFVRPNAGNRHLATALDGFAAGLAADGLGKMISTLAPNLPLKLSGPGAMPRRMLPLPAPARRLAGPQMSVEPARLNGAPMTVTAASRNQRRLAATL